MKILVTGAYGFIGSYVLPALLADQRTNNIDIYTVSRNPQESDKRIKCIQCDLLNGSDRQKLIEVVQPTHLIHLAWETKHGYQISPQNLLWVKATIDLFDKAISCGCQKISNIGTIFEYSDQNNICTEYLSPCIPNTPYGYCKLAVSSMIEGYRKLFPVQLQTLRLPYIAGKNDHQYKLPNIVFNDFFNKKSFLCKTPSMIVDYLDVRDVASAIIECFFSDVEGIVNIGSGVGYKITELLDIMARIFVIPVKIGLASEMAILNKRYVADITRLKTEIGFVPKYSLEECFQSVYDEIVKKSFYEDYFYKN